jgi:hypothetical protein
LTVPDVKAALARFEKYNVEVFKPLGVASNETIPVPEGKVNIVPGYAALYKQIAMIKVRSKLCNANDRIRMVISSSWSLTQLRSIKYGQ